MNKQPVKIFEEVIHVLAKVDIQEMVLLVIQHLRFQMIKMKIVKQLELELVLLLAY